MQPSAKSRKTGKPAADDRIREEALRLSGRDAAAFLDALDNPPAPVDNLVQALNAHSHLVKC